MKVFADQRGARHHIASQDKKCLMCDDQVREARRLHEVDGKRIGELAVQFNVKHVYMKRVLNYIIRSKVL